MTERKKPRATPRMTRRAQGSLRNGKLRIEVRMDSTIFKWLSARAREQEVGLTTYLLSLAKERRAAMRKRS